MSDIEKTPARLNTRGPLGEEASEPPLVGEARQDESGGIAPVPIVQVEVIGEALTPVRVIVIDDELSGLTSLHFRESAAEFSEELLDVSSPLTAAVWELSAAALGLAAFETASATDIQTVLSSDDFVAKVVLSVDLKPAISELSGKLANFYDRSARVAELKSELQSAYAAPAFDLTFVPARPALPETLLDFDLVILDLVLAASAAPVDELVGYLAALSVQSYPRPLPALIVLSSREEMVEHRLRFSTESTISAAGLILLRKRDVGTPQFGAAGLRLCYAQLLRQRGVAQKMRVFVREWTRALDDAKSKASTTLWNLDAAAMQEIHLSAHRDDDPFDEHLSELVAREYLWHVENSTQVSAAIDELDKEFVAHFKPDWKESVIGERFMAPFSDPRPGRDIVSHYNWVGFPLAAPLGAIAADYLALNFNRLVPFGAVLAPEVLEVGSECWVHITQQCDLNNAVRGEPPGGPINTKPSAMFAMATAIEVNDRSVPKHSNVHLVARGLSADEKEYDLRLLNGRLISLPVPELIASVTDKNMRVVGRLRHDIATHFLSATANHMTRPASLKTTRVEIRPAQIAIAGPLLPGGQPLFYLDPQSTQRATVAVSNHNGKYYLQDDTCMWVALWIEQILRLHFARTSVSVADACNALQIGMTKGQTVVSVLSLGVEEREVGQIDAFLRGRAATPTPVLYVFFSPPVPDP